jgi:hypothetical protein
MISFVTKITGYVMQTFLAVHASLLLRDRQQRWYSSGYSSASPANEQALPAFLSRPCFPGRSLSEAERDYSTQTYIIVLDKCVDAAQTRLEGRKDVRRLLCDI